MDKINSKESVGKLTRELSHGISYFAYGSNLSLEQMNKRCPNSVKIGKGVLENYKWIINSRGYANVIKSPSDYVEGIVYRITKHDENTLDEKEGVKKGCYEKKIMTILMDNREHECLVYVDPITDEGKIKSGYEKRINVGIVDSLLSPLYIEKYIREFMPDCSFDRDVEFAYSVARDYLKEKLNEN
jgi:gamma-glutamylcyclotransferase